MTQCEEPGGRALARWRLCDDLSASPSFAGRGTKRAASEDGAAAALRWVVWKVHAVFATADEEGTVVVLVVVAHHLDGH